MDVHDVIAQARDSLTVKRVFGDPYEQDGVTVIPAARVQVVTVVALLTLRSLIKARRKARR
jgi:hypothetical protein